LKENKGDQKLFELKKKDGRARRGVLHTVHGDIQTPVFMNVGTCGAIKGGVTTMELRDIKCQVELSNTYHLHIRPGDKLIYEMGGLRKFMNWDKPVLTDSGGFQVFSLSSLRKITEEGVHFASHIDGKKIFMGPEESMQIQSNLASTIAMAFDECIENPAPYDYVKKSCERTTRWLIRCKAEMERLNSLPETINKNQLLFGINQGGTYEDLRIEHMKEIAKLDLPGYAIGGLAVGESTEDMYRIIDAVEPYMPENKPRYLMGVGTPCNILEAVHYGVDFFDCVMPSRNARHGNLFTWKGKINLLNEKYMKDERPFDEGCGCPTCRNYSRAYVRHLIKAKEAVGMKLAVTHNLYFYNELTEKIREALDNDYFESFYQKYIKILGERCED
jgi:queuine tRNA-ribosyltransferase